MATLKKNYQLKITLLGIDPPIWRRLLVPSTVCFAELHQIIQVGFGWENAHLFSFRCGKQIIEDTTWDEAEDLCSADKITINQFLGKRKKISYTYDFGDCWEHEIVLEQILDADSKQPCPFCLGGERRAPLEDLGGVPGYYDFLEALSDPQHPEHEELREWAMGDEDGVFDFEYFDAEEVNQELLKQEYFDEDEGFDEDELLEEYADLCEPFEEPSDQTLQRLTDAGIRLKQLAPWETFTEDMLFLLREPGTDEPLLASVTGAVQECFGVAVFFGVEGILSHQRILQVLPGEPLFVTMGYHRQMLFSLGNREDLADEERKRLRALGYRFRGKNQWVVFCSTKPGFMPWKLDEEESKRMAWALEQVALGTEDYRAGKVKPDFDRGEVLLRTNEGDVGNYFSTVVGRPVIDELDVIWAFEDEITVARLRKCPQIKDELILEPVYLPFPIESENENAPRFPMLSILMDAKSGTILNQVMGFQTPEGDCSELLELLIPYIEEKGRPRKIYLRNSVTAAPVRDFCNKIGINIAINRSMEPMDRAIDEVISGLLEMGGAF